MLVARITGCAPARLTDSGTCLSHSWTFETVEDLKGSNAMVRTLPSDEEPVVNTCDLAPKVGATYLLFMHDGRTSRCSGTHELEAGQADQVVETLRAHRDGATNRITDPWHFTDNGSFARSSIKSKALRCRSIIATPRLRAPCNPGRMRHRHRART